MCVVRNMCKMTEKRRAECLWKHFLWHEAARDTPSRCLLVLQVSASRLLCRTLLIFCLCSHPAELHFGSRRVGGDSWFMELGAAGCGPGGVWCGEGWVGEGVWSHHFLTVWLSGCCYGFKPQSALTVSELQSCSQAVGLASKGWGAVGVLWGWGNTSQSCPGAAAERRLPSVVWMGPVRVFGCVWRDFYGAYTRGELRLVGFEPWPIGFQALGGDSWPFLVF